MIGYFSDFWPKNFKMFSKLPSTCPGEHVVAWIFFKKFESFWIFYRNLWHGSQNSIYVFRVKIAEEKIFLFYFSELFRILSERFSDFGPKNFKKLSKLPSTCAEEQFVAWNFFFIFWIVLEFLEKPLAWFSKFYLRVQSKNCGRIYFFILLFRIFWEFERKIFRFLAEKLQKVAKITSVCADEQFLAWNFFQNFWTVLDFLQKPLAWCSNFYLRVQSKNSGRNNFF